MKAFFSYLSWLFFARPLKRQLRTRSLQALGLYVQLVKGTRKASMLGVAAIIGLSSITVGFFLLVGGLLWLANLNPAAYPWIMVAVGALLTIAGVAGSIFAFRERLWIDLSRINDLTRTAIEKFPADERKANPAVTAAWDVATEAMIREHSKMDIEIERIAAKVEPVTTIRTARPAPRMEPAFQR